MPVSGLRGRFTAKARVFSGGAIASRRTEEARCEPFGLSRIFRLADIEKGERRFELFVDTTDHAESRDFGWSSRRKLVRLAADFPSTGTSITIAVGQPD